MTGLLTIDQIEALRNAATPGPWRLRVNKLNDQDTCDISICGDIFVLADLNGPQYAHQRPNAELITTAPDLAATAIDALTKLAAAEAQFEAGVRAGLEAAALRIVSLPSGMVMHSPPQLLTEAHDAIMALDPAKIARNTA